MNKPLIISSVVALGIGFSLGWVLRQPAATEPSTTTSQSSESSPKLFRNDVERPQQEPSSSPQNTSPRGNSFAVKGTAVPPESLQKAERAKWQRLIEVLGLDSDQAKAIEAVIAQTRPMPDETNTLDVAYAKAGEDLEQKIIATLNPEQQAAFREMQQRSLQNRVEVKAQKEFAESLTDLDLTTAQRDQALEVLRIRSEQEATTVPTSARLILKGSLLPIGNEQMNEDSFELMGQLQLKPGEKPQSFEQIAEIHRAELERRMTQFEGILSPAQLAPIPGKPHQDIGKYKRHFSAAVGSDSV